MEPLLLICFFTLLGSGFPTPLPLSDLHIETTRDNNLFFSRINEALTASINHHYAKQPEKRDANSTQKEEKDDVEISVQHFSSNFPFPLSFSVPSPKDDTLENIDVVKDFSNTTVTEYKLTPEHEHDKKSESSTVLPTTLHKSATTLHSSSTVTSNAKANETISTTPKTSGSVFMDGFDNSTSHPLNKTTNSEQTVKFVETSTNPSSTSSQQLTSDKAKDSSKSTEPSKFTTTTATLIPKTLSSSTVSSSTTIKGSEKSSTVNETTTQSSVSSTTLSSTTLSSTGMSTDSKLISISVNSTVSQSSERNSPSISTTISAPNRTNDKISTENITTTISLDSTTREARLLDGSSTTQKSADNSSTTISKTTESSEKSSNSSSNSSSTTESTSIVDKVQSLISRKLAEIHG